MTLPLPAFLEPDVFLAWEREQRERHGYFHGQIFDTAGGLLATVCWHRDDRAARV